MVRGGLGRWNFPAERRLHMDWRSPGLDRSDSERRVGALSGASDGHHGVVGPMGATTYADDGRGLPSHSTVQWRVDSALTHAQRVLPASSARGGVLLRE